MSREAAAIGRFVDRLRLLLFGAALGAAAARCAAIAAVAATANALVAERAGAPPWLAFGVAAAGTAGLAAGVALAAVRLRRPPSRAEAARRVEGLLPAARNDVESSLELAPVLGAAPAPGVSRGLVGALVAGTAATLAGRSPRRFVPLRPLRDALLLLAAATAPLAAVALLGGGVPPPALRAVVDPRVYWPLGRHALAVEPGDARVARGAALDVRVRAVAGRPAAVRIEVEGEARGIAPARGADGSWSWRFPAVAAPLRYRAVAGAAATPWFAVTVVEPPAAGDFEVGYAYPAYSGLAPRRVPTDGSLEGLRGTTATVEFSTSRPVARAVLAAGGSRVAAEPAGERRYRGTVYLDTAPSWRLELQDAEGFAGGGEHPIRYLPDAPPVAELLEPAGAIDRDPGDEVALRWRAADDYGLSAVALVVSRDAGERRQGLPPGPSPRSAGGEATLDLAELDLRPGETLTVAVEAADNDAIGGPKRSRSAPLAITIADPRLRREEAREELERLADDLVQLLAEELDLEERYREVGEAPGDDPPWQRLEEAAARQQAARDAAERAARRAERLAAQPGGPEEEVATAQAQLVARGLRELQERRLEPMRELAAGIRAGESTAEEVRAKAGHLGREAGEAARAAEQLALMADAMRRERGREEAERGARDLATAEERLLDELERLSPGDRKAAAEVMRQLDEIERGLRELAEALARDSTELPEEYLNSEALKGLDVGEILSEVDRIREMLARGDLEGAKRAAKALAAKIADLRSRLQRAADEVDEKAARGLDRLRGSALPELERLAAEQQQLLARTEAIERAAGPRLERALEEAARAGRAGEGAPAPAPPAEEAVLTPDERSRALALAREQEGLRARAAKLGAELAALRAALPFLPAELGRSLDRAGGHMEDARGRLGAARPGEALDPERAALAELRKSRDGARQALDELEGMQSLRGGGGGMPGGGMPTAGSRPGPGSDPSRGRRSGGRRGTDVRNFAIPGRQDHRVPQIFREEILKALREGYPPQYEGRIRDYYQRIAE